MSKSQLFEEFKRLGHIDNIDNITIEVSFKNNQKKSISINHKFSQFEPMLAKAIESLRTMCES